MKTTTAHFFIARGKAVGSVRGRRARGIFGGKRSGRRGRAHRSVRAADYCMTAIEVQVIGLALCGVVVSEGAR